MCGITAAIALDQLSDRQIRTPAYRQATLGQLWRSLATIRHRGPDSSGTWFSPDNRVALAHTRLAIKDLSPSGAQPLHDSTNSIHAIVNGEFYDYASLKQELTEWGYTFQGDSDSELLLALYARDGQRCFESLRGEFAFVLYDSSRQLVIAARDRYGVKPLFWTISEGRLLFASEAKAFKPLGWKAQWDVRSITEDGWLHDERTLFKGVRKVLPGKYMICHSFDFINQRSYWEVNFPDKHIRQERSEQDMTDELEERLVDAVTARMQGDVPMGVYLSGGLDSAAVAGIAVDVLKKKLVARAKGQPLNDRSKAIEQLICFNVGFDSSTEYDETPIAQRTAEFLGLPFVSTRLDEAAFAENFEQAFLNSEHHNPDLNSVAKFVLSGLAREHGVKVILSGEGSDEHFGGYKLFLADFLRESDKSFGNSAMSESERIQASNDAESSQGQIYKGVNNDYLPKDSALARKLTNDTLITKNMIPVTFVPFAAWTKQHFGDALSIPETRATNTDARTLDLMNNKWHTLHTSQLIWTKSILPNLILTCMGDRMEMSHSVEGRPVFLDHHLTEFVNHLPPSVKIRYTPAIGQSKSSFCSTDSGYDDENSNDSPVEVGPVVQEKWILREATKKYITPEMYARKKYPFTAPYMFPVGGPLHELMERLVTRENIARLGFVDVDATTALLGKAFVSKTSVGDGFALRMLLVIAQWVVLSQAFDIETAGRGDAAEDSPEDAELTNQASELTLDGTA